MLTEKIVDWLLEHSSVELVPEGSLSPAEETAGESETTEPQSEAESAAASTESI